MLGGESPDVSPEGEQDEEFDDDWLLLLWRPLLRPKEEDSSSNSSDRSSRGGFANFNGWWGRFRTLWFDGFVEDDNDDIEEDTDDVNADFADGHDVNTPAIRYLE